MVNNFQKEIEGELLQGEVIEKCFEGRDYRLIGDFSNISIETGRIKRLNANNCRYTFVITNKRVFVGNVYPFSGIVSYNIYNKSDIDIKY